MLHKSKWWLRGLIVTAALLSITGCANNDEETDTAQQAPADTKNNEETPAENNNEGSPGGEEGNNGNAQTEAGQANGGQTGQGQASDITGLQGDEDLEAQLEKEKGIEDVMVQVVEGNQKAVNVDIQINNKQELSADELIAKYSEVIKKEYPDHIIDIIVAREGKVVKQTTIE